MREPLALCSWDTQARQRTSCFRAPPPGPARACRSAWRPEALLGVREEARVHGRGCPHKCASRPSPEGAKRGGGGLRWGEPGLRGSWGALRSRLSFWGGGGSLGVPRRRLAPPPPRLMGQGRAHAAQARRGRTVARALGRHSAPPPTLGRRQRKWRAGRPPPRGDTWV